MAITRETVLLAVEVNDEYGVDLIVKGERYALTPGEALQHADELRDAADLAVNAAAEDAKDAVAYPFPFDVGPVGPVIGFMRRNATARAIDRQAGINPNGGDAA